MASRASMPVLVDSEALWLDALGGGMFSFLSVSFAQVCDGWFHLTNGLFRVVGISFFGVRIWGR